MLRKQHKVHFSENELSFIHNRKKPQPNRNLSPKYISSNMKCVVYLYILFYFSFMLKGIPVKNVICLI